MSQRKGLRLGRRSLEMMAATATRHTHAPAATELRTHGGQDGKGYSLGVSRDGAGRSPSPSLRLSGIWYVGGVVWPSASCVALRGKALSTHRPAGRLQAPGCSAGPTRGQVADWIRLWNPRGSRCRSKAAGLCPGSPSTCPFCPPQSQMILGQSELTFCVVPGASPGTACDG